MGGAEGRRCEPSTQGTDAEAAVAAEQNEGEAMTSCAIDIGCLGRWSFASLPGKVRCQSGVSVCVCVCLEGVADSLSARLRLCSTELMD